MGPCQLSDYSVILESGHEQVKKSEVYYLQEASRQYTGI